MPPRQKSNIQFVLHSNADGTSSTSQREIHSHAARVAHARTRVSRMRDYNKQLETTEEVPSSENVDRSLMSTSMRTPTGNEAQHRNEVWPSPLNALSTNRRDQFGSTAVPLKPIEHFLLDHFVTAVMPHINQECLWLKYIEETYKTMMDDWVQFALGNEALLRGILLAACRRLNKSVQDDKVYRELAVQYKLESVRFVIDAISRDVPDKSDTFARIITLAFDEVYVGDLPMFERHLDGAIKLVHMMGGPKMLLWDGFLESMYGVVSEMRRRIHSDARACPKVPTDTQSCPELQRRI